MAGSLKYTNEQKIAQVELAARQCRMSYGQYVSVTGGKIPPPEELVLKANPGAMSCPNCDDKPDDLVPVGRWFSVTDGVRPPEGALVLTLHFSAILADWRREPFSAIYRDGKWYHVGDDVQDIEWKGVRYWSPWPEMEADDGR